MPIDTFHVAPFTLTGELIGQGTWKISDLSSDWIDICSQLLAHHGDIFNTSWTGELSHITTKLTSSEGAGMATFRANNELAISTLYLSGTNDDIDNQVRSMFVSSITDNELVRKATTNPYPFKAITDINDRPLAITVIWGNTVIDDKDEGLIQELSTHFAAAFFLNNT